MNATPGQPRVMAAFDVGSNSIKMTVALHEPGMPQGQFEEFLHRSEVVRLGEGLDRTGRMADDRIAAALQAINQFAAEARTVGAERLIGVATEATRVASNGQEFLNAARDLGLHLVTISGDQEAALTFAGLDAKVDRSGLVLVADIGGGSTELIEAVDGNISWAESLPIGSGRLTDGYVQHDPPLASELQQCQAAMDAASRGLPLPASLDRLVVTGGAGVYLQRLLGGGMPLDSADVAVVLEQVTHIPTAALAVKIDAPVARARVLPAGIAVVSSLVDRCQPAELVCAQSGIRTGLLMAAFAGEL